MENCCKKDLLEMGWTEGAIRRFLPPPSVETRRNYYGTYQVHLWPTVTVEETRKQAEVEQYFERVRERNRRRQERQLQKLPLIDAIREVSRSAHRWRDAAQAQYQAGNHGLAGHSKREKERLYGLKERGIAAAYMQRLLRYAGASPQGMGVYEYGDGGKSCFHSCLHPAGVERPMVEEHPEILEVNAKPQEHAMADAQFTLSCLAEPGAEFERTAPPRKPRDARSVVCYECGEEGHIARECPNRQDDDDDF